MLAGTAVSVAVGIVECLQCPSSAADFVDPSGPERVSVVDAAIPRGPELQPEEFGLVGVFDIDWLLEPRFTRLLDNFAASPGAFTAVRFFGALNSGQREDTVPTNGGGVWREQLQAPDFSTTLAALNTLVSRNIVPFITLSFFPPAVSSSPVTPPHDFSAWGHLVQAFLNAVVARFGGTEVARWRLEVWNEPNYRAFWTGSFDQYLALYQATSEAVTRSGHAVTLGGPALVYTPDSDGATLMRRFLRFLAEQPAVQCNFISYHRKGAWFPDQDAPWLNGLKEAAEAIAQDVLRLAPARAVGMELINNEGDMKVGFDQPFEPRLTQRFTAWLASSLIVHEALNMKYAETGLRFLAAADDANQQLIRTPFDGRRSVMTRASGDPDDLVKLPVYGFYELLPMLRGQRALPVLAAAGTASPATDLLHLATVGVNQLAALFTVYPDRARPGDAGGRGWVVDYTLNHIPWRQINAVWFRVDDAHTNPLAALAGANLGSETTRRVRAAQELSVAAPIRSGLILSQGEFRDSVDLPPFATALLWITPYRLDAPAAPIWMAAEASQGNAVLRWTPTQETSFYSYEVFRLEPNGQPGPRLSPSPLRSALWVDTNPPPGNHVYAVRTMTASGATSPVVSSPPVRI